MLLAGCQASSKVSVPGAAAGKYASHRDAQQQAEAAAAAAASNSNSRSSSSGSSGSSRPPAPGPAPAPARAPSETARRDQSEASGAIAGAAGCTWSCLEPGEVRVVQREPLQVVFGGCNAKGKGAFQLQPNGGRLWEFGRGVCSAQGETRPEFTERRARGGRGEVRAEGLPLRSKARRKTKLGQAGPSRAKGTYIGEAKAQAQLTCAERSEARRRRGPEPSATRSLISFSSAAPSRCSLQAAKPAAKVPVTGQAASAAEAAAAAQAQA
jgi:hypothetical protein